MNSGNALHAATIGVFGYFTLWIIIRPFIEESVVLELIFPEIHHLIPVILLTGLWFIIGISVVSLLSQK